MKKYKYMDNAVQIVFFMRKIGKEIWENGELSSNSKSILRSVSISDIWKYREQFQQMAFQQLRYWANTPITTRIVKRIN